MSIRFCVSPNLVNIVQQRIQSNAFAIFFITCSLSFMLYATLIYDSKMRVSC